MTAKNLLGTLLLLLAITVNTFGQNSVEYSYFTGKDENLKSWGTNKKETYNIAIKIDNPSLRGLTVTALRIPLVLGLPNISDYTAFLTHKLEAADGKAVADIANVSFTPEDQWTVVKLPQPYTIGDQPFYAGYRLTIDKLGDTNKSPIAVANGSMDDAFWVATSRTYRSWEDRSYLEQYISPIAVVLEGEIGTNAAIPVEIYDTRGEQNKESSTRAIIANVGVEELKSLQYRYEVNGKQIEAEVNLKHPVSAKPYGSSTTIEIKVPAQDVQGTFDGKLSILRVNGQDNPKKDVTASNRLNVIPFVPVHRAVMEEFTGTWCGWCPRGWIAMEMMKERHPDNFIAISYHYGDIMQVVDAMPLSVSTFPSASIDRGIVVDPYYGNTTNENFAIERMWQDRCNETAPANIEVEADLSEDGKQILATTTVTFAENLTNHPYRLSYYVTANGLKGKSGSWLQSNFFAGNNKFGEDFRYFIDGDPQMQIEFNDVLIERTDYNGVEGSLAADIHTNEQQKHSYQFNVADMNSQFTPGVSLVQDVKHLNVVVMIVNTKTGRIENAAKCAVRVNGSGIKNLTNEEEVTEVARYALDGRQVDESYRGFCVVYMSDGSVHKLLVR